MKPGFLDKLIARIDQVDPGEVQNLVMRLVREKGFLESVFEALREGVMILDPDSHITFVNHAASRIFGVKPNQCTGHTLSQTIRGLEWNQLANPNRIVSRDLEIFYPEKRLLNLYISPIREGLDDDEDITTKKTTPPEDSPQQIEPRIFGYVLIVRDITQTRQQEEESRESEKLNALTLLAAGVAHEIGNPLNSLNIHLQLLERKINKLTTSDRDNLLDHLHTAQGEIRRLDIILKQFLQAIRPSQPDLSNTESVQLHHLLKDTLAVLKPELEERNVQISLDLADSPPFLRLDGNQIKQALYNLIKNAFQSLPASGGLIEISTKVTDYEMTLTIRDHGSGISPEIMGSLFEPFHSTKSTGSGLGLLIVRRIMREHGGNIEIESEEGKGTSVILYFPRQHKNVHLLEDSQSSIIEIQSPPTNSQNSDIS